MGERKERKKGREGKKGRNEVTAFFAPCFSSILCALKGQLLIAQGNALGFKAIR